MNRGFATIFALVLMGIIAAALSTMAITLHVEQKRAQSVRTQAALRQLLLAGASDTLGRSRHWPETLPEVDWTVDLPVVVAAANVKLKVHRNAAAAGNLSVKIDAESDGHKAGEIIQLRWQQDQWILTAVSAADGA